MIQSEKYENNDMSNDYQQGLLLDTKPKTKKPSMYNVIILNDDYTPMEFVTWSLMEFFHRTEIDAQSLTLQVHKAGSAVAGIYDYQIAEQKIWEVLTSARENQFPLQVTGETE